MNTFRFLCLVVLSISLVIISPFLSWIAPPLVAQITPTAEWNLPTRLMPAATATDSQVLLPDWQRISFGMMPPIQESGSINTGKFSRQWKAGQTPDLYLTLGDIESALRPDLLSLSAIAKTVSNLDLKTVALDSFPLVGEQTLQHLTDVVPNLGQISAEQIPPIAALLKANSAQTDFSTPLSTLLDQNPAWGKLKLNEIDLLSYAIADIPNIDAVQLGQFQGWQDTLIADVPALNALPLAFFPVPLTELGSAVARIDTIWGRSETRRQRTVSGSDVAGFSVKCEGQECPYIELDDLENSGRNIRDEFEGRSWISGKYQLVRGGWGCLQGVNGGKEETGRLPYGSVLKVVVMEPDEKTDTVDTALFFRFKNFCGATPYFVGPVPFFTYKVNSPIFIGTLDDAQMRAISVPASPTIATSSIPGEANTSKVTQSYQPICTKGQTQSIALATLTDAIAGIESSGGSYSAFGAYVCADGGTNCGVPLGKYQFMSYNEYARSLIASKSGGSEFLTKLSKGYKPSEAELWQFFPPAEQETAWENSISDKVAVTSSQIDPTTGQIFAGDRLIERVAQKHFGGDYSQVDSSATDVFGRLTLKTYGEDVLKRYKQNSNC